jgi:hypothetical protein
MTPEQQKHYDACIAEGTSPALAEMFATGQTPGVSTTKTFLEGMSTNGSQFESKPEIGDYLARDLKKSGGSPKGKVYLSGLALYPGDPKAWVSDKSDVKRVCRERDYDCSGAVSHQSEGRKERAKIPPRKSGRKVKL